MLIGTVTNNGRRISVSTCPPDDVVMERLSRSARPLSHSHGRSGSALLQDVWACRLTFETNGLKALLTFNELKHKLELKVALSTPRGQPADVNLGAAPPHQEPFTQSIQGMSAWSPLASTVFAVPLRPYIATPPMLCACSSRRQSPTVR